MDFDTVNSLIASLGTMKYFPSDPGVRLALVDLMSEIAESEDQVRWLVKRLRTLYAEWPGERELRACFCSKFRPKDGINACSTVYLDGIPSEKSSSRQISAPQTLQLPPGRTETADASLDAAIAAAAQATAMPSAKKATPGTHAAKFERALAECLTGPKDRPEIVPTPQIITQADIDRAVEENRRKQAETVND